MPTFLRWMDDLESRGFVFHYAHVAFAFWKRRSEYSLFSGHSRNPYVDDEWFRPDWMLLSLKTLNWRNCFFVKHYFVFFSVLYAKNDTLFTFVKKFPRNVIKKCCRCFFITTIYTYLWTAIRLGLNFVPRGRKQATWLPKSIIKLDKANQLCISEQDQVSMPVWRAVDPATSALPPRPNRPCRTHRLHRLRWWVPLLARIPLLALVRTQLPIG